MGLSDDGEDTILQKFEELCLDLNLDKNTKDEAWESFERTSQIYTLEGNSIHWLCCALYVSCRTRIVSTVGDGTKEGNCVSLTRLLRTAKLSFVEFFKKMKNWMDMSNLPQNFRDKIDKLERKFAVSTVIFKKYEPIFLELFRNPADDPKRGTKSRKQSKRLPCTVTDVFNYCWTMFVYVKGRFPTISDDLVNSYHLLVVCLDWFYANAIMSNRKDLVHPDFPGLPEGFMQKEYKPPSEVPCTVQLLCDKHEGLNLECKTIKGHWWKPHIKKLFDKKVLKGKAENLTGILELGYYDTNSKNINNEYEMYVLNEGDFDEKVFLGEDADIEIGTPSKLSECNTSEQSRERRMRAAANIQQYDERQMFVMNTPLTGRAFLQNKITEVPITPVSTATQSVSKLQSLLTGSMSEPSPTLSALFQSCSRNPQTEIESRIKEMGKLFCEKFTQPSSDRSDVYQEFTKKRVQLAECLYFKTLENVLVMEQKRLQAKNKNKPTDFTNLLEQDVFHQPLFACCLEVVLFSYNSQRKFPWVIDVFGLPAYCFYKVIEVFVRAEEGLSRDTVKHLNRIEEIILESLAWTADSPLWDKFGKDGVKIPSVEDVTLPTQIDKEDSSHVPQSPIVHPALQRLGANKRDLLQSPTGPSIEDRFSSPMPGSIKRRLFSSGPEPGSSVTVNNGADGASSENSEVQHIVVRSDNGATMLVPIKVVKSKQEQSSAASASGPQSQQHAQKPKKTGSIPIFFRKVYHLASVRLRDLCERLDVDSELRRQMWTCFEHTIMNHTDILKDRHLDQLVMCSVYVMAKVTQKDRSFQDIMKCYRMQPQAQSHVYRSVLLGRRSSTNQGTDSPPPTENREGANRLINFRSTSSLSGPAPGSHPPTPTGMTGTGTSFEYDDQREDRGDLITFYNNIYVKKIKQFAQKFSSNDSSTPAPLLSPLPLPRAYPLSPRKVSTKHSVYVSSPKSHGGSLLTPQSRMLYCFNRSPAKDLRAINNMLRMDKDTRGLSSKRISLMDDGANESPAKRSATSSSPAISRKLESILIDRQAVNGSH